MKVYNLYFYFLSNIHLILLRWPRFNLLKNEAHLSTFNKGYFQSALVSVENVCLIFLRHPMKDQKTLLRHRNSNERISILHSEIGYDENLHEVLLRIARVANEDERGWISDFSIANDY